MLMRITVEYEGKRHISGWMDTDTTKVTSAIVDKTPLTIHGTKTITIFPPEIVQKSIISMELHS